MKRFFFYLLVLEVSLVAEAVFRHFPLIGIRVDLVWLLVLTLGFFQPLATGGPAVFLIALAQEAVGAPLHGVLPLSYLAVYFFLRFFHQHLFFEKGISQVIWILLLTFLQKGLEQVLLSWQGFANVIDPLGLIAGSILSGLVSLPLFPFLRKKDRIAARYAA